MSISLRSYPTKSFGLLVFFLCLFFMPVNMVSKADASPPNRIEIYVYGPVIAQITDSEGHRSGRNLVTGNILEAIPEFNVIKEQTMERIPGWTFVIPDPVQGNYRIKLLGTGPGGFVIDVDTVDSAGNLENIHVFRRVKAGDSLEFLLRYSGNPAGENTLLETIAR